MFIDPIEQLRKLGELRTEGIISEAEFSEKKTELLSRIGRDTYSDEATWSRKPENRNPPALPLNNGIVSRSQVDAARSELELVAVPLENFESAKRTAHDKLAIAETKLQSAIARQQVRDLGNLFPLGRYGALILLPTMTSAIGAIIGIGTRFGPVTTTWLILACGLAGACLCSFLFFWPSDEELHRRKAKVQSQVSELSRDLAGIAREIKVRKPVYDAANAKYESLLAAYQSRLNTLLRTDWRCLRGIPFEEFLCNIFRELGFACELTKGSGDQGVDLIARMGDRRLAIQAKGYAESVGNKAVQEAHAGMSFYSCHKAIVITNSSFTSSAIELAARINCQLIEGTQIPELILGRLRV